MKIVVAGGTGFLGGALVERLIAEGHHVIVLTRKLGAERRAGVELVQWDGRTRGGWVGALEGADAVVNLVGETLAGLRWTAAKKSRILASRVESTSVIVDALRQVQRKPSTLINVSGIGFYGHVVDEAVAEGRPAGTGFIASVVAAWEATALRAAGLGVRIVLLRTGVVLGPGGGALEKMALPFRLFVGGPLGPGTQWFPWVHRDDFVAVVLRALSSPSLEGPVNVVAPDTVTMKQFCSVLGRVLHRPSWIPVPTLALKMLLGEMSAILLEGQHAVPAVLDRTGFVFRFPRLEQALRDVLR